MKPTQDVVLVLTVVLGHGQEVIEVRAHDRPHQVAVDFCKAKGLDPSTVPAMTQFIEEQLAEHEPPRASLQGDHLSTLDSGERVVKRAEGRQPRLKKQASELLTPRSRSKEEAKLASSYRGKQSLIKGSLDKTYSYTKTASRSHRPAEEFEELNSLKPQHTRDHEQGSMKSISLFKTIKTPGSRSAKGIENDGHVNSSLDMTQLASTMDAPQISRTQTVRSHKSHLGFDQETPKLIKPRPTQPSRTPTSVDRGNANKPSTTSFNEAAQATYSRPQTAKSREAPRESEETEQTMILQSIFKQLKPSHKGTLNFATVTRGNLTDDQAAFLRPLLEKLITTELEMDFEEFCVDLAYLQRLKHVKSLLELFPKAKLPAKGGVSSRPIRRKQLSSRLISAERQSSAADATSKFMRAINRHLIEEGHSIFASQSTRNAIAGSPGGKRHATSAYAAALKA
jgi:hypothetical protein